jgi:hypothetical protein
LDHPDYIFELKHDDSERWRMSIKKAPGSFPGAAMCIEVFHGSAIRFANDSVDP